MLRCLHDWNASASRDRKLEKIDFCASNLIDISDYSIFTNLNLRRLSSFFACLLIRVASWTLCVFETKASLSCHLLSSEQWADNSSLVCLAELSLSISIALRRHVSTLCRLLIFRWWVVESSAYCHCIRSFDNLSWIQAFWINAFIRWISCRRVAWLITLSQWLTSTSSSVSLSLSQLDRQIVWRYNLRLIYVLFHSQMLRLQLLRRRVFHSLDFRLTLHLSRRRILLLTVLSRANIWLDDSLRSDESIQNWLDALSALRRLWRCLIDWLLLSSTLISSFFDTRAYD